MGIGGRGIRYSFVIVIESYQLYDAIIGAWCVSQPLERCVKPRRIGADWCEFLQEWNLVEKMID